MKLKRKENISKINVRNKLKIETRETKVKREMFFCVWATVGYWGLFVFVSNVCFGCVWYFFATASPKDKNVGSGTTVGILSQVLFEASWFQSSALS